MTYYTDLNHYCDKIFRDTLNQSAEGHINKCPECEIWSENELRGHLEIRDRIYWEETIRREVLSELRGETNYDEDTEDEEDDYLPRDSITQEEEEYPGWSDPNALWGEEGELEYISRDDDEWDYGFPPYISSYTPGRNGWYSPGSTTEPEKNTSKRKYEEEGDKTSKKVKPGIEVITID